MLRQGARADVAETAVDPQMNWTMLIDGVSGPSTPSA